jgi:hypothetical protein
MNTQSDIVRQYNVLYILTTTSLQSSIKAGYNS